MEEKKTHLLERIWKISVLSAGALLVVLTFSGKSFHWNIQENFLLVFPVLLLIAFVAEYVDSSIGMGYGTTLTPVLLIFGFEPIQVVPAVLLSEFITGLSAGILHHKAKNTNLAQGTRANRIMHIMSVCSIIGTLGAVALAVNLNKEIVKLYIALMITGIGFFIFSGAKFAGSFSWKKIIFLGSLAAFNKGISGGGYGPLVTGGQVLSGVKEKDAVAITSVSESAACLAGFILYLLIPGSSICWNLALPLTIGAILSVPAAVLTVKVIPEGRIRKNIAFVTLFLGVLAFIKIIL